MRSFCLQFKCPAFPLPACSCQLLHICSPLFTISLLTFQPARWDRYHVTWISIDCRLAQGLELRLMPCNFAHAERSSSVPCLHTQNETPKTDYFRGFQPFVCTIHLTRAAHDANVLHDCSFSCMLPVLFSVIF